MVVLSASICTKTGKALISRQFVEMTRIRIEGLLAAFPKLLGSDSKQHTFIETDSVRYLYQPMEGLYLLLITNKASNIIQDLDTLRLLSKVVPDIAGTANNLTEEKVTDKCFELIFAFDEVITSGGYREPINLQQIRTNLEMESHEEKLHNMIKISKIESAKDQANDAAKVIRERQRAAQKAGTMQGIGSDSNGSGSNQFGSNSNLSGMGSPGSSSSSSNNYDLPSSSSQSQLSSSTDLSSSTTTRKSSAPVKGMSLASKNSKNKSLEDALVKEDKLAPVLTTSAKSSQSTSSSVVEQAPTIIQQPVMLAIVEKLVAKISRDGVIDSYEIKGSLTLTANNDESGLCSVQMKLGSNISQFTLNTHPKINKPLFDRNGLLQLKDTTKGFPSARPVGILKWTYSNNSDDYLPLKINCWPEEEGRNRMNVSIEYTMERSNLTLHDVEIKIPLGTSDPLSVATIDGTYKHIPSNSEVLWQIPLIDSSNGSGSFEFSINQKNTDDFFPITVQFSSSQLLCQLDVVSVTNPSTNLPIQYGLTKLMSTEEYVIE
mmetsp:Transcript_22040/g.22771  ORF Transcript_22040/g.22771 Transcript_22040/m.22771 type:complete len:546 (-) Transcript_22040:153-1790(-)